MGENRLTQLIKGSSLRSPPLPVIVDPVSVTHAHPLTGAAIFTLPSSFCYRGYSVSA